MQPRRPSPWGFKAAWRIVEGGSLGQSSGGDGLWRMNSINIIGSALKELLVARMVEREVEPSPEGISAQPWGLRCEDLS